MMLKPGYFAVIAAWLLANVQATSWADARAQANALVAQMTSLEKENVTQGQDVNTCSGQTGSVERLRIPGFCLQDAENGVRLTDFVNAYSGSISLAASWNVDLAYQRASYMGAEFKRKGNHAINGPVVGPLGRVAKGGRAFEGMGADRENIDHLMLRRTNMFPAYLSGKLVAPTVKGLQESVMAVVKHYIFNEQETLRTDFGSQPALSSNVDDVTNHELYLWPFADAVRADAAAVMASYNRINGTSACENEQVLTNILKGELAFEGFVVSDWGAQHSGAPSAAAGLDMAMPQSKAYWQGNMQNFVNSGNLTQARYDDMVARILTAWHKVIGGPDADFPEAAVGMPSQLTAPHPFIDGRDPASKPTILQGAIEGHVLVKNTNNSLPLNRPKLLSLFGFDATVPRKYYPGPSQGVDYIFNYGLESAGLNFSQVVALLGGAAANDPNFDPPDSAVGGQAWNGGGSGASNPSSLSETYGAIQIRARRDDTQLYWDFTNETTTVHPLSSACLVFINDVAAESYDRHTLASPGADQLVSNIASQCTNTIVVIHNPSIRTVDAWIDNDNVTALIYAHYPGQDLGEALAQILYGEVSPSGRLPYTVAKTPSDYGPLENPCVNGNVSVNAYCNFDEGIYTDYRYFQKHSITPRYAFGYGLTYSSFSYSSFKMCSAAAADLSKTPPSPNITAPGGTTSLFDVIAQGSVTLNNTGSVAAAEVAQLYVHFPGEADQVHFLRGFDKVFLQPGQSRDASFNLTRRDLSRWNTVTQQWELATGHEFRVGPDSGRILYNATLQTCS